MEEQEKFKLEDFVERIKDYRARHTELITVYVPSGLDINIITKQLESEKSTAANIKSTSTRKNVQDALESLIRVCKQMKRAPKNGVALFAGNVSQVEGQADFITEVFEPPEELNIRLYRCDQTFVVDPLEEMLEIKELYGLVVIERKEATIGLLVGKKIKMLKHIDSFVPGKVRAGGQCLSPDTLIMKDNGELIEIKDSHNPLIVLSENFNSEETEKGIEEKPLSEIKEGDYLIMPEKINLNLPEQQIDFNPIIKQGFNIKYVNIPKFLDKNLAKIFGYYLGDGSYEIDRLTFFEQRKEVARYYKKLLEETFGINVDLRFRESKNYYQIRIYSRLISQLFKEHFLIEGKTLNDKIPSIVLKSPDYVLASFISGFFDAEGYVSKTRVALGINNSILAKQLQFALLRIGVITSMNEYDNRRNPYSDNIRYTLAIDDLESLKIFKDLICFSSKEKQEKVKILIEKRSNRNKVRQLVVNGSEVARIIRNSGLIIHNSSQRYHRITEGLAKDFYRKIADIVKSEFFNLKNLKGILVGGPGPTKEDFLKEGQLITALQDKVLAVKDIGYADEHGLELLVETSQDVLAGQEIVHEQKILEKFFNMLGKERGKTAYGRDDVEKALSYGAVDILLLSRKLKKTEIKELEKKAAETSTKVELISTDLDEGIQFWNLSGIGAILRFKIS